MGEKTRVYWKRVGEAKDGEFTSGCCLEESVPSYGTVQTLPLPTEVSVTHEQDGSILAVSPPVIGARYAYRYHLRLSPQARIELAEKSGYALELMLNVMKVDAPVRGATRENWWWYSHDQFTSLSFRQKIPVSLMRKWKRAMLEILLETHPERDQKLAAWDQSLAAHEGHLQRARKSRISAQKKADGDLVVLPSPQSFEGGSVKQIFSYDISPPLMGGRAKHSLRINGTRYRTRHGQAVTFHDGRPAIEGLSLPIRTAMMLLAWSRAPLGSAHAILAAMQNYQVPAQDLLEELAESVMVDREDNDRFRFIYDLAAAHSALKDFQPRAPKKDAPVAEIRALEQIRAQFERALELIELGQARLIPASAADDCEA